MRDPSSRKRIVTFGELLLRLTTKAHARFTQAREFEAGYTGAEANTAVSLAQFGMETFVVSRVPSHEVGQACVNALRAYGVNTDYIVRGGTRLGLLYVEPGAAQRASNILYDREHSSFQEASPNEFDWETILAGKAWLHFCGTAPARGANVVGIVAEACRTARRLGVKVSCDFNYRSKLWSLDEARRVMTGLMEYVDVGIGGAQDAEQLFGIAATRNDDNGIADAAERLRARFGFDCVAMSLREGDSASANRFGALLSVGGQVFYSREYVIDAIVDRIGAGDALAAGLIYGLLSGAEGQRTIDFAAAAACLKHTIPGDFNLISVEEIERLMAGESGGRVNR